MADFATVKEYVLELGFAIAEEIPEEEIIIVNDEERGVQNLVVDCEDTVLVIEQLIIRIAAEAAEAHKRILQMNRDLIFGAFVLNEEGDGLRFAHVGIKSLADITQYLYTLDKTAVFNLGLVLGLDYNHLKSMIDSPTFLEDMLAGWLQKGLFPLSMESLGMLTHFPQVCGSLPH